MNRRIRCIVVLGLSAWAWTGCAHMVNTPDGVKIGMKRDQALRSVNAAPFSFEQGSTKYLIYQVVASFTGMYRDNPNSVLFVRLEKGVVVDKGVVGKREEARIRRINPAFELEDYQRD